MSGAPEDRLHEPEPETVRRAQAGDTDAFEELVRLYLPDVYRWARHVLHDPQSAEDVAQDTFLNAYRSLRSFRWKSKFSTWLFRITRNCALEATRRSARLQRLERERPPERPPPDLTLRLALRGAINALPTDLRDAFVAIEIFGFSYPEAATVLDVPVGTLKSRIHRTRRMLIEHLALEDAGEV